MSLCSKLPLAMDSGWIISVMSGCQTQDFESNWSRISLFQASYWEPNSIKATLYVARGGPDDELNYHIPSTEIWQPKHKVFVKGLAYWCWVLTCCCLFPAGRCELKGSLTGSNAGITSLEFDSTVSESSSALWLYLMFTKAEMLFCPSQKDIPPSLPVISEVD